ncbi:MAG: hypothetical protein IAE82_05265 [Opitutaceae bacterium]|nr:hypothetical protein [Opitutaceae bacterium]
MTRPRDTTVNTSWVSALAEALSIPVSDEGPNGSADSRGAGAPRSTEAEPSEPGANRDDSALAVLAVDR